MRVIIITIIFFVYVIVMLLVCPKKVKAIDKYYNEPPHGR